MTVGELLTLPENGGYEAVTDPQTGYTTVVRRPAIFLVYVGDVVNYDLPDGTSWRVGRDGDGVLRRERSLL